MLKVQEKTIEEMKIMLYQSVAKEYLKKDKIQKFEEWLAGGVNLSREEEDVIYMVSKYLKQERTADELIEKEQFMENPFGFYSSYLAISLRERESIITDDLVKYYQAQIKELESRNTIKDREIHSSSELNRYYLAQVNEMSDIIKSLQNQISELENEIEKSKKPSLESMKRDNLAMKSKQREKDTQIKDLQEKVVQVEHENDQLKDTNKALKKEVKEIKQDCDLKNKQSFRIVQSERDELEEKLRNEIQQRVSYIII